MFNQSMLFLVDVLCSFGVCAGLSGMLLFSELEGRPAAQEACVGSDRRGASAAKGGSGC